MGDNFLTAPLTTIKQIGEQSNQAIQSLGSGMANVASKGIDALVQGAPALPGMGGGGGSESLAPASLTKVLSKVEEVVLPASVPRLSQKLGKTTPTSSPAAPTQPASTTAAPASPNGGTGAKATVVTKQKSSSRITEMRGM